MRLSELGASLPSAVRLMFPSHWMSRWGTAVLYWGITTAEFSVSLGCRLSPPSTAENKIYSFCDCGQNTLNLSLLVSPVVCCTGIEVVIQPQLGILCITSFSVLSLQCCGSIQGDISWFDVTMPPVSHDCHKVWTRPVTQGLGMKGPRNLRGSQGSHGVEIQGRDLGLGLGFGNFGLRKTLSDTGRGEPLVSSTPKSLTGPCWCIYREGLSWWPCRDILILHNLGGLPLGLGRFGNCRQGQGDGNVPWPWQEMWECEAVLGSGIHIRNFDPCGATDTQTLGQWHIHCSALSCSFWGSHSQPKPVFHSTMAASPWNPREFEHLIISLQNCSLNWVNLSLFQEMLCCRLCSEIKYFFFFPFFFPFFCFGKNLPPSLTF